MRLANPRIRLPREICSIREPTQGFLTPQHLHHLEDSRGGGRAGKSGAQWLRDRAKFTPVSARDLGNAFFRGGGLPGAAIEPLKEGAEQAARVGGKQPR